MKKLFGRTVAVKVVKIANNSHLVAVPVYVTEYELKRGIASRLKQMYMEEIDDMNRFARLSALDKQ